MRNSKLNSVLAMSFAAVVAVSALTAPAQAQAAQICQSVTSGCSVSLLDRIKALFMP